MNQELIDRYENYLKNYKRSNEKTIRNYIYDLKAFDKFIDKEFTDVSEEDVNIYLQDKKDKKISPSRINFSIATLSSFYKYLKKIKITKDNPVENIPRLKIKRKKEIEYLSTYQIYETRRKLAEYGDKQLEVFFGILVASAPKKYMISKLEWRKINWKQNYIEVVINEKERGILYLDNYTMERLTELRKERKDKHIKKKWIFITRYKGNWKDIGDSTITYWLNKIATIVEVDRLTISSMKATMLHYLKNGRRFSDEKINKILNMSRFDNEFRSIYLQDLEEIIKME